MPNLEVKIPPMGESITSGILAKWHVKDGDIVKKDQPLFELETDKITSESTAEAAGKITLQAAAGDEVKIGQVVAMIDPAAVAESQISDLKSQIKEAPATAAPAAASQISDLKSQTKAPAPAAAAAPAAESQISNLKSQTKTPAPAAKAAAPAAKSQVLNLKSEIKQPAGERQTRRKLSPLRQRIAERLVAAQHEAAMLTTFNEVDMSAIMAIRAKYQDDFVKKNGLKLGFMSFFVKAVVQALKEVPAVNAQLDGDTLVENHFYDIGVAVSTERGLMVPVIRDCASLGMAAIEKAIAEVAARARDGKIALTDLEGGVFTITNGGIFGSLLSTPIINPPQSAILGMHTIQERPVAINGQVVIRPMMYVALSYDHRIVDGREAVTFLVKVKQSLEDPARLLLSV
ncbi:MAG TPA: 2-oxoglutarate dehydrogenase complex dihydrolipoyllysine-residue succinyltransferase [Opitutaceae bacterium]|jgi:2-oxoglutarate dehydrogenase E2 component (dihydrolipoamide succinyltransferase)|nr:2-oxoglutarate dehydrogenase complex dihydrolipoyllysine-residue succinyltransferase [Opitutaceae bacterium]